MNPNNTFGENMSPIDRVRKVIFGSIDELNKMRSQNNYIEKTPETMLFTDSAVLDSLELINLIVIIEDQFMHEFKFSISLTDEKTRSLEKSPFKTIHSLINYVVLRLEDHSGIIQSKEFC